ncbi:MAG: hypothetical protein ABIH53_03615 [archaeon]
MKMSFEIKPTAHEVNCKICRKPIKKGDRYFRAEQCMYPGTTMGGVCLKCLAKGIKEKKNE